jgi:hypothetical protein
MTSATLQRGVMMVAPGLLFVFSLLHGADEVLAQGGPPAPDEWVRYVASIQARWLALHVAGLGLFPLLGLTVLWMLPYDGIAGRISRLALAAYIVLYPAFDALVGIGSYILIQYRDTLPAAERTVIDPAIKNFFFDYSGVAFKLAAAASIAWGLGVLAAVVAVWRPLGWRVALPLAIAGLAMSVDHAPPFGSLAGIMLGGAVWQFLARQRQPNLLSPQPRVVQGAITAEARSSR